ncbi:AraC family transcriptional regulator [Paenibacillus harenae]|uniref:AraC family transcriptional regulator n=1 Tax=Paenibacillus harenae TaxID=306543 RepID=UPI0004291350|nr:AraC family transcriptional regulator [Paenibacillus harenae]
MNHPVQLFIDSLNIEFHHLKNYELDGNWRITGTKLQQSVFWYVTEGRVHVTLDGTGYAASAGELLHLPAGCLLTARPAAAGIKLLSLNFAAAVSFLPNRPWHELLRFPVYWGPADPAWAGLLREMNATAGQTGMARSMLLQAGIIRMVGLMIDRYMASGYADSEAAMSADIRIHNVIAYMMQNPSRMPSVSGLAELVQLSESHLRKLFMLHIGMPPQPFIHRMKVEQAKRMLAQGSERISGIAALLGFQDPNYFARLFKQHTALSPKQFRDKHRNWMTGATES